MKLHTVAAAAAFAFAAGAFAQTSTTQPPASPAQQTQPSTATGASPSTPPTHPSERTTPSTTVPNTNAGSMGRTGESSLTEAQQACKNLSDMQARKDCMDKAEREHGSTSSGTASPSSRSGSDSGMRSSPGGATAPSGQTQPPAR